MPFDEQRGGLQGVEEEKSSPQTRKDIRRRGPKKKKKNLAVASDSGPNRSFLACSPKIVRDGVNGKPGLGRLFRSNRRLAAVTGSEGR